MSDLDPTDYYRWLDDAMAVLARHRERYVQAWIAATGLHPTECQLVERVTNGPDGPTITIRVERIHRQPMNTEGVAVDDATSPCGLAQTTTPSGAGPTTGARNADHPPPGPEAAPIGAPTTAKD